MPTRNHLKKFRIKLKWLLIPAFLLIAAVTIAGNVFLAKSRPMITRWLADQDMTHKISMGKMFFVFPNFIVLKDISLSQPAPASAPRVCLLPTTIMQFSLIEMFAKKYFLITDVILHKSEVNYQHFSRFCRDNLRTITTILENIPKEDIKIRFKDTVVDLGPRGDKAGHIWTDFCLTLRGDAVSGNGLMRRDKYSFSLKEGGESRLLSRGLPLQCALQGFITPDGFSLENFSLSREDMHIKFWAGLSEDMLQLNGFALINTPPEENRRPKGFFDNILKRFKRPIYRQESSLTVDALSQNSFFIMDIDCRVNLTLPWLHVERFKFTVNNAPVSIEGDIFVSEPPSLDIAATFYPAHSGRFRSETLEHIDFRISGALEKKAFHSDAGLNIYFVDTVDSAHSPDRLEFEFKDMTFNLDTYDQLKILLGKNRTSFWSNKNIHTIRVNDLEAILNFRTEGFKFIKFHAPFYDGEMKGKVWMDTARAPFKITSSFVLSDVNANKLDELLIHFSKVEGRLFSNINFTNYPQFDLSGGINVQKGVLTNYDFFNWLADSFDLPSLKKLNFRRASASFSVDQEKAGLHDIQLESEEMSIAGYFNIATNSLVSSTLSLSFSRELLAESRKCKLFLQLFEPDMPAMDFGFKLSGDQHAMNFQWLPSDIKMKIQDRIPDFIERKIERSIDESFRNP